MIHEQLHGEATGNANGMVGIMVLLALFVLLLTSTAVVGKIVGPNPTGEAS